MTVKFRELGKRFRHRGRLPDMLGQSFVSHRKRDQNLHFSDGHLSVALVTHFSRLTSIFSVDGLTVSSRSTCDGL
jgi:hypothetical protein